MKTFILSSLFVFASIVSFGQSTTILPQNTAQSGTIPTTSFSAGGAIKGSIGASPDGAGSDDVYLQTDLSNTAGVLKLRTKSNTRLFITADGKVAVGGVSAVPLARFNVVPFNNITQTTAVFGTSGTGISLQQNYPAIGFNQYHDDANTSLHIGSGFAGLNYLDATNGRFYWNTIANGAAGSTTTQTNIMSLTPTGYIGLGGIATPNADIHLPNVIKSRRVLLWEEANNDHQFYGLGINAGTLRYQVSNLAASHIFYAGATASSSNEIMRIGGNGSFAAGNANTVSNVQSTALGYGNDVSGATAFALGGNNIVSGGLSFALGSQNNISSSLSTAIGNSINLSASNSVAFGQNIQVNAGGTNSMTMIDGSAASLVTIGTANRFSARYANGFFFYSNSTFTTGAFLGSGANSWASISDSTKKEKFLEIDGESMLRRASKMRATTWNYKGQDSKTFRHYGPMAQEFFAAFGHDTFGTIGNDTTIASADIAGVNFALIQALEKRTQILMEENTKLKSQLTGYKGIMGRLGRLEAMLNDREKVQVSGK
jgi:Chaperone of endosialidase